MKFLLSISLSMGLLLLATSANGADISLVHYGKPVPSAFGRNFENQLSNYEDQEFDNSNYGVETWDWLPESDFGNHAFQISESRWFSEGSSYSAFSAIDVDSMEAGKPTLKRVFELQTTSTNVVSNFRFFVRPEFWIKGNHPHSKFFKLFKESNQNLGEWQRVRNYVTAIGSKDPFPGIMSPQYVRPLFPAKTNPDRYSRVTIVRQYQFEAKEGHWRGKAEVKGSAELSNIWVGISTLADTKMLATESVIVPLTRLERRESLSDSIRFALSEKSTKCFRTIKAVEGGVR